MTELQTKIVDIIEGADCASLATVSEDGKPWVRFVIPKISDDLTLCVATFASSRKIQHIARNPEVHLTAGKGNPPEMAYLQIQGRAEVTDDKGERDALWTESLGMYFQGADDPEYRVLIIRPYRIEVNIPGSPTPEIWEG